MSAGRLERREMSWAVYSRVDVVCARVQRLQDMSTRVIWIDALPVVLLRERTLKTKTGRDDEITRGFPVPNDHGGDTQGDNLHLPCPRVLVCLGSGSGSGLVLGFSAPPHYRPLFSDILLGNSGRHIS